MAFACALLAVAAVLPEPSAMGEHSTDNITFYLGGFKGPGVQDAYLVFPSDLVQSSQEGSLPLVAFSHGAFKKTSNDTGHDYNAILRHVASHGIVVAAYNTCLFECNYRIYSEDQLHLISALHTNTALHPILPKVNFSAVALMGHSMGGGTTITNAGSGFPGLLAALAIHPATGGSWGGDGAAVKIPTFFMCGQADEAVHCPSVKDQYQKTPAGIPKVFAELKGATHLEIQKPLPGGRWDYYIVQYLLCVFGGGGAGTSCFPFPARIFAMLGA